MVFSRADAGMRIVFAEEDTLFRLMEAALLRRTTPSSDKALAYLFGADSPKAAAALTAIANRVGLPGNIQVLVCTGKAELDDAAAAANFLVAEGEPIGRSHIQAGVPDLRLIQKFGMDCSSIDVAAASDLGVKVANLSRLSTRSAADNVMALLLALARNLVNAHRSVLERRDPTRKAQFEQGPPKNSFNWTSVRGIRVLASQTLGLIGLGEIATEVARRGRGFGMRVVYTKRHPLSKEQEAALGGVTYLPLKELLTQADFISIHVPYGPDTDRMIGRDELARMKRGAYLINTSRGGVIDEEALYAALQSRHIAAAGLDVYRYEPVPANCPLLDLDNVLWTPHMAGGEPSFMLQEVEDVLANIARVWRGEPPSGWVNA